MPTITSKKTGVEMTISDAAWGNYGKEGLQNNFRVTKKDVSPPEVTEERTASAAPKKLGRTSGETAE